MDIYKDYEYYKAKDLYDLWRKENIDDVIEKNGVTRSKLTDGEKALGINEEAVAKEKMKSKKRIDEKRGAQNL